MSTSLISRKLSAADDWAVQCSYWRNLPTEARRYGPAPRRDHKPLILTGHGMHLRIHRGALVVRNGFTHYPQAVEEYRFFPGDRRMPSRVIIVDGDGSLSFDALSWLSEQNVPLIKIDWRGRVVTAVGPAHAINSHRLVQQLEARRSGKTVKFATALVGQKIANSIATLKAAIPSSPARDFALSRLSFETGLLKARPPKSISSLLGMEGRVAYAYFRAWQSLPLRWTGVSRHPIPEDWQYVGQRQSFNRMKARNKNASHPVNAILNYAYAILESQVRIQVLAEGYDPTIGFLHSNKANRPALIFDLMEPLRPVVDRKVLEFVQAQTFHRADFTIRPDGVCRLNPELAKTLTKVLVSKEAVQNNRIGRDLIRKSI